MASTRVVLPWSTCAIMAMLRSFEFIVCRFVMSMRPDEQGCKRYLATPIELREVSGATNACLFYHATAKSARFPGLDVLRGFAWIEKQCSPSFDLTDKLSRNVP